MSNLAPPQQAPNRSQIHAQAPQRSLRVLALAIVLASCFYVVEHSWHASSLWQEGAAREADEIDLDEIVARGSRTRQIAFASLGLCGGILLLRRRGSGGAISLPAALFCAYFGIQLASVMWSIDPMLSAKRSLVLLFLGLAAMGVNRVFTVEELRRAVLTVCALFLVVGVLAEIKLGVFHPLSTGYRFAGTVHPNTQAVHCALLALTASLIPCRSFRQMTCVLLLVSVSIGLLLLTKSRTSLLAFAATASLLVWLRTTGRTRLVLAIGLLLVVSSGLLLMEIGGQGVGEKFDDVVLLGRTGKTATLSGRVPLWSALVPYLLGRPILGYGYGAFWSPDRILEMATKTKWQMVHSHNAYIETLLAIGLLGLLTMLTLVFFCLARHMRNYRTTGIAGHAFFAAVAVFFLVYSCLEAGFLLPTFASFVWMIGIAAAVFSPASSPEQDCASLPLTQGRAVAFSLQSRSPAL